VGGPKCLPRAPAVSRSIPHRRCKRWKSTLSEGPYAPHKFVSLFGRQAQPAGQSPDGGCTMLSRCVSRSCVPFQRPQTGLAVELVQLVPCFVESNGPALHLCVSTPIVIIVHLPLAHTKDPHSVGTDRSLESVNWLLLGQAPVNPRKPSARATGQDKGTEPLKCRFSPSHWSAILPESQVCTLLGSASFVHACLPLPTLLGRRLALPAARASPAIWLVSSVRGADLTQGALWRERTAPTLRRFR
jgi:hypothetical protein